MGSLRTLAPCALFALNLLIGWRLFNQDYTAHYDSIEPFFYALADYLKANWLHPGWWNEWNCGMPFRYTYQPLLHYSVAAVSALSHWSSARAFHFTLGFFYAAGPVTLYFLVLRLSGRVRIALTSALLYSLWSPSALLMPDVAADTAGLWNPRRLHSAVIYGDAPHVAGLTLVPLALLLLDRAARRGSLANYLFAALATIAVPLTNIPAALALAMLLIAYCLAADPPDRVPRLRAIVISSLLGYLVAAPLLPPSEFALVALNTQWMEPAGKMTAGKFLAILAGLGVLAAYSFGLQRFRVNAYARLSVIFTLITAIVVLGKAWGGFSVLAQPLRFHLAMEMAIVMAIGSLSIFVKMWSGAPIVLATMLAFWQIGEYRAYARKIIKREPPYERSEYRIAHWLDRHAGGNRVMVPGSVSFWLNAFTTTPQLGGCCAQNFMFPAPRTAVYEIGTDDGAGDQAAAISIAWLKAMGVKYVAMSGPLSTEEYKTTHHPHKFDGILPKRWQDGDDAIFEVPGRRNTLAHWVTKAETVTREPINGIDTEPLQAYTAAMDDETRPEAILRWLNSRTIQIRGTPQPNDLLSIQIPFHPGWHAKVPIAQDALGFLLLNPNCHGACDITLTFDGGREATLLDIVCALAWVGVVLSAFRRANWSPQSQSRSRRHNSA